MGIALFLELNENETSKDVEQETLYAVALVTCEEESAHAGQELGTFVDEEHVTFVDLQDFP